MKRTLRAICTIALLAVAAGSSDARTIIVDKTGLGDYTTIQAAVNAAVDGDTVRVFPGVYNEQVVLRKDIVLQGSGYEYTHLVADASPALDMSAGKVMWLSISSNVGDAVTLSAGLLTNSVVWNSPGYGVYFPAEGGIVKNSVITNTVKEALFTAWGGYGSVINSIVMGTLGYRAELRPSVLYSRTDDGYGIGGTSADPQFVSATDFRIAPTSPCWDTGKPDLYDPDGSRSDMGYYGGPDAPVYPVVTDLRIFLNADGTVTVQATAKSRY